VPATHRVEPLDPLAAGARRAVPAAPADIAELHRLAAQRDPGMGGVPVTAAEIAAALGGARREGRHWRCICPLHAGASLALRDDRERLLVRCWAGCDTRDVLAELRRRGLIGGRSEDSQPSPVTVPRSDDRADAARRSALAQRIWNAARDARGSPVARYLAARGIPTIPLPPTLRWAPSLRRPDGTAGPAMVARVDSLDGELIAVHRTWIDRDAASVWRRRDRASLGLVGGGAVRLAPAGETLLVAEGIETALAAMQATAQPAWAALSTSGIVALALPSIVRTIVILADHDRSGAGLQAALTVAQRWFAEGRRVRIAMPPEPGTDFADMLAGCAHARIVGMCDVAA
jgi:putative DNA primase/helicase